MKNPIYQFLRSLLAFTFLAFLPFLESQATSNTLYNDLLDETPAEQSWLLYASDAFIYGGTASEQVVSGVGVKLITDNAVSAGYSNYNPFSLQFNNPLFPVLDRSLGFSLSFEVQINTEAHSLSDDRAGFSVILLADDHWGIELGFWADQIWAQNNDFTYGEISGEFDTTTAEVSYELFILGDTYSLMADGTEILTGSLRKYLSPVVPYQLSGYLFLGDDTSSAQADIILGKVVVATDTSTNPTIVLPPSVLSLLLLGLVRVGHRKKHIYCILFKTEPLA